MISGGHPPARCRCTLSGPCIEVDPCWRSFGHIWSSTSPALLLANSTSSATARVIHHLEHRMDPGSTKRNRQGEDSRVGRAEALVRKVTSHAVKALTDCYEAGGKPGTGSSRIQCALSEDGVTLKGQLRVFATAYSSFNEALQDKSTLDGTKAVNPLVSRHYAVACAAMTPFHTSVWLRRPSSYLRRSPCLVSVRGITGTTNR